MRSLHLQRVPGRIVFLLVVVVLVAAGSPRGIYAQSAPMSGHDMSDMQPVPPPEQLPVPVRMTGIGNSHITIKATPEAQAWFDQGLNLMHDFWEYESAKAFEQGIRVDPKCAMCWGGLGGEGGGGGWEIRVYSKKR